jgi:hypothetical protein
MMFNQAVLASIAISVWKRGGLDTLVKVLPIGMKPDPSRPVGYCTTLKYIVGRTPAEMEQIVGFAPDSKLVGGADVFIIRPIPDASQFQLRGYSQCPGGVPTDAPGYVSHPLYPPGLGTPQWDLNGVSQSHLVQIASVQAGLTFSFEARRLPPVP